MAKAWAFSEWLGERIFRFRVINCYSKFIIFVSVSAKSLPLKASRRTLTISFVGTQNQLNIKIMLIKTFWRILIKIVGLFLLFGSISVIPRFTSALSFVDGELNTKTLIQVWGMLFVVLIIYFLIISLFLFKTEWIVNLLKLESNFTEDRIDLNIKTSTVLTISIIVIGGLMIAESLPSFCSNLFDYLRQKSLFGDYPESSWIIYHFLKILIGYLLLTNGKNLTNFVLKNSSE